MRQVAFTIVALALACGTLRAGDTTSDAELRKDFADPPLRWHSRPLWFWNGRLDAEKTRSMVAACKDAGYYGMGILPTGEMGVPFMTPEFLNHYQAAVGKAAELGMKLCLYDEFWFPSGSAGGLLAKKHPEALSKRLDVLAVDVTGPQSVEQAVPAGMLMGVVAMNMATKQRENITSKAKDGKLVWDAPTGEWKVMLFTCVPDGGDRLVDYLSPEAVKCFIELTYQAYYDKFPSHFGTTIDSAFYDEPAMYHVKGGRAWTDSFNEKYKQKFADDPVVHYPALFMDIGPDTAAARNALFGMRAELYATGFPKTINDWCREHRIQLTGHVDQEELVNPVIGQAGDLIKAFKHQNIPGLDQIFSYGRGSRAYKVVSSAAYNFDHQLVMTECYGAIKNMPLANLYKEAMDQFAKGINMMVPHAVWYASPKALFPPDLTPGAATYGPELAAYNKYIGRLQRVLQTGRHVADIGVLYPIATLQAGSWFGPGKPYEGCVDVLEADYMQVGEALALGVRRDFTFIHPEVLDAKCSVKGTDLHLENKVNAEQYKVFVIPGSRTIHWSSLKKIKEFYDNGGKVIATTRLPDTSAEFGKDKDVRETIAVMFGTGVAKKADFPRVTASSAWAGGGFEPSRAVDGDAQSRWNAADGDKNPQWLEVDFGVAKTFVKTTVREAFERTRAYRIQSWNGAKWNDCVKGEQLGAEKTDTFAPVSASKVRLCLDAITSDSVSIYEFEICDAAGRNLAHASGTSSVQTNAKGGKTYFIASPQAGALKAALDAALKVYDVAFENDVAVKNGNLSYIHKVVDGRQVYFFGNSSDAPADVFVRLRGKHKLELWDPHTGTMGACEAEATSDNSCDVMRVRLKLAPIHSVFIMGNE
ncbi:MAG TPA: glycosyl hydrolase [Planctomycetota bacterium]|jgi:hypothetical protein